jgi:hypothetical protein
MRARAFSIHAGWLPLALSASVLLTGCDALGIETPGMANAKREAEGRAIGAACRHAVRSIEDCHASNPRISRSAIFDGWREMDEYMRENEVEGMPAPARPPSPPAVSPGEEIVTPPPPPGTPTS